MGIKRKQIKALYKRELASHFAQPIGYVFIGAFIILAAIFSFYPGALFEQERAHLGVFFSIHPFLYLIMIPALTMGSWAQERQSGTIELIMTYSIANWQIITAKFLAVMTLVLCALIGTLSLWWSVAYLGTPDHNVILVSYFGSLLMAAAFVVLGLTMSAVTKSQVVSFILAMLASLFFVVIGVESVMAAFTPWLTKAVIDALVSLSFIGHFNGFVDGVIAFQDVSFFLIFILCWSAISLLIIDYKKAD